MTRARSNGCDRLERSKLPDDPCAELCFAVRSPCANLPLALRACLWYIPETRRFDGVLYRLIQQTPNLGPRPGVSSRVKSRRYTVVIADRTTGVVRRFTFSLRPTLTAIAVLLALPILIGLGARWSALAEVSAIRTNAEALRQENQSFRAMTAQLTDQVASVQTAVADLSAKAVLDPESARALAKLPPAVRSRAMGGGSSNSPIASSVLAPTLRVAGRHVRLAAGPPRAPRQPARRPRRTISGVARNCWALPRRSGRPRAPCRPRSAAARIRSGAAAAKSTPASTSPAIAASRSSRRRAAWSSSPGGTATTATW